MRIHTRTKARIFSSVAHIKNAWYFVPRNEEKKKELIACKEIGSRENSVCCWARKNGRETRAEKSKNGPVIFN